MLKKSVIVVCVMIATLTGSMLTGLQGPQRCEGRDRHPAVRNALRSLDAAKAELQHADHDFGGHRAEALEAVDNAIKQLNKLMEYEGPRPQDPTPKPTPRPH